MERESASWQAAINGTPSQQFQGKARWFVYPFFGFHMLMFGLSGFLMAYAKERPDLFFIYLHGGIACFVYLIFYRLIFGAEEVRWMLINAALGILGIYAQIGWLLERFGKDIYDYPWYVNITPFLYYVLYTFLLRQFLIDVTGSRSNVARLKWVNALYVAGSLLVYGGMLARA